MRLRHVILASMLVSCGGRTTQDIPKQERSFAGAPNSGGFGGAEPRMGRPPGSIANWRRLQGGEGGSQ